MNRSPFESRLKFHQPFPLNPVGPFNDIELDEQESPMSFFPDLDGAALAAYRAADVVVVGYPNHDSQARPGARLASGPEAIRRHLPILGGDAAEARSVYDLGDVRPSRSHVHTLQRHLALVRRVLADGKRLVMLCGSDGLSYANAGVLREGGVPVALLSFSGRLKVDSTVREKAPISRLLDEGLLSPRLLWQFGHSDARNRPEDAQWLLDHGAHLIPPGEIWDRGLERILRAATGATAAAARLFWSFDLDAVHADDAPGVSRPNAQGFSGEEFCAAAACAGMDPRTRVVELLGLLPERDIGRRTEKLAVEALRRLLSALAATRRRDSTCIVEVEPCPRCAV